MSCVVAAFIFIAIKFAGYCQLELGKSSELFLNIFFWFQFLLVALALFAIVSGVRLLKRIRLIGKAFDVHCKGHMQREVKPSQ